MLDRDVADSLKREMRTGAGLKSTINDALRRGLRMSGRRTKPPVSRSGRTPSVYDLGSISTASISSLTNSTPRRFVESCAGDSLRLGESKLTR
jgi:hypothetical protein